MKIYFETKRLIIRTPVLTDAKEITMAASESFNQLRVWLSWSQEIQTLNQIKANLKLAIDLINKKTEIRLLAFSKDTGELVVSTGMHEIDWQIPKFSIGYWIRSKYQGQGYATEAVTGLIEYSKRNFKPRRIEITTAGRNLKSRAVAERCGFKLDARMRNHRINMDGKIDNTCIYSLVSKKR